MYLRLKSGVVIAGLTALCGSCFSQQIPHPVPNLIQKNGRYALMVDGAPFLILGAQANNSSAWPAMLPKVWPAIEFLHANTLEIPIYWEQFEPTPGHFDYTVMDTILSQARAHHVHLVLLWFGTWKNGSQHYMPEWMKLEPEKYFHVVNKDGRPVDSPSPFATASLEADIRAFSVFMRHLKAVDPEHNVLLVQVENETGTWGTLRDYSPAAQKLFDAPVPANVLRAMQVSGAPSNWREAFGPEADICFHAWAIARYVQQVAAAGKAIYPLPLYANAALRDPLKPGAPGTYESGGPTDNVIPIWKATSPAIDILAPDIYLNGSAEYLKVLDLYHRADNPLFVPETSGGSNVSRLFFSALGHQAIGFSPFGLDYTRAGGLFPPPGVEDANTRSPDAFLLPAAENYRLIAPMMRDVARLNFEGKLQATAEEEGKPAETLHFEAWDAIVSYGVSRNNGPPHGNALPTGRALVAQLGPNRFLVAGLTSRINFQPVEPDKRHQFLRVEEGEYVNGAFKFLRILNGDQTDWGLNFASDPKVLRVSLATY